jgi:integrase
VAPACQEVASSLARSAAVGVPSIRRSAPESDAGRRVIALDSTPIAALREHRLRQQAEQAERADAGAGWTHTGYVFTSAAGKPVAPDRMTRLFAKLVAASGLPPVTLHGLRHGAATLAQRRGAASDATFRNLREDGAVRGLVSVSSGGRSR